MLSETESLNLQLLKKRLLADVKYKAVHRVSDKIDLCQLGSDAIWQQLSLQAICGFSYITPKLCMDVVAQTTNPVVLYGSAYNNPELNSIGVQPSVLNCTDDLSIANALASYPAIRLRDTWQEYIASLKSNNRRAVLRSDVGAHAIQISSLSPQVLRTVSEISDKYDYSIALAAAPHPLFDFYSIHTSTDFPVAEAVVHQNNGVFYSLAIIPYDLDTYTSIGIRGLTCALLRQAITAGCKFFDFWNVPEDTRTYYKKDFVNGTIQHYLFTNLKSDWITPL